MSIYARNGDVAEIAFLLEATKRGFTVLKTFGISSFFDFVILSPNNKAIRVQIKSRSHRRSDSECYYLKVGHSGGEKAYTKEQVDVLGIYLPPENAWYFFPIEEIPKYLALHPNKERFKEYLNNWDILNKG